ncbi:PepSY domain-containing protein [Hydrogenophaga flava]|uniref:PepSY domain-containing protein n=1 Tax=Hydrogenophaga flava TaxID=65657 RepID=UPI00082631AA|nr:PepSY domain-containing protein [Hydrogenophaga flava]
MASSNHRFSPLCATALVLAATLSAGAQARDRGDHERAREAVVAGQILPLRTVLERLEREQAGQVLEIELEPEGGRWIYEVKLLQPGGQLLKLEVDAGTGEVLGRRVRPHDRRTGDAR